jgi:enterochelin esterase family protein
VSRTSSTQAWLACSCLALGQAALAPASEPSTEPQSPRLRALAASLDASDSHALDTFWQDVERTHTPLIESIPDHPQDVLFTFLWRAQPGQVALNVQFNGWFPLHNPSGFDAFTRLGESNVWYTSYALPRFAHLRYELIAPKGFHASPDRATYFTMDDREYETFHDPLNPRLNDWNDVQVSYAQGPAAKTSPYLAKRADVPHGSLETMDIDSKVLGNRRTLRIYLPPGYASGTRDCDLLLMYDGNQYTTSIPTPRILDNMIAAKAIAPVVAVFLESPDRDVEFPPNDDFQRFVATELVPRIRARYRVTHDPRRSAAVGSSYGGIAAAYTAFSHPELFGNVVSQSGSFGWSPASGSQGPPPVRAGNPDTGWLIKRIAESPRKPIRFHLDVGIWEGPGMLSSNRILRSVLAGKGYETSYVESDGTHHAYYWMLRLPQGLQDALGM